MTEQPTDRDHEPAEQGHGGVRYERKDIRLRVILIMVLSAGCFVTVVFLAMWQYFGFRKRLQEAAQQSPYSQSPTVSAQLPSEPRLEHINRFEGVKSGNVYERLAAQEKILHSFGPTDDKGFVHIPIDEAIKAVAGHLPVRKDAPSGTGADNGLIDSGEPNSGRMLRGGKP